MFSIIIPLYNKADYVAKAINSVLNQTFTEFELIIVNDGSTDNSLEIVGAIHDGRIRIINQKNSGVSTARNNGAKSARFDYVAFLDADDWWDATFLQEMSVLTRKYPKAELYASNYNVVRKGREISSITIRDIEDGYINYFDLFLEIKAGPVCSSAVCIKKQCFFNENGFKANLKSGEDLELWFRVACKYKIAYRNRVLAFYNQDVDTAFRAVGNVFPPENHYLFCLDDLNMYMQTNKKLKCLTDFLILETIRPYLAVGKYRKSALTLLKKVSRSNMPLGYRMFYFAPFFLYRLIYTTYKKIKQHNREIKSI
jgi:glycosyltransferase involved in cell wall biosynthesis